MANIVQIGGGHPEEWDRGSPEYLAAKAAYFATPEFTSHSDALLAAVNAALLASLRDHPGWVDPQTGSEK